MSRPFNIAILFTISALLAFASCNPGTQSGEAKSKQDPAPAKPDLAKLFADAPSGLLDSMDILCANSRLYQAKEWDQLNNCRWALEKQLLAKIPEYAKRKDDLLSLQIDNGQWLALAHEREEPESAKYFQFRKYLPQAHYFIVTQHFANDCPMQWFIDAKTGQKLFFPGTIWQHPQKSVFITGAGDRPCKEEVHLIHFDRAGEIKFDRLDLESRLKSVKWINNEAILQLKNVTEQQEYRKWVLP